jgi:hypothetical protein
MDLERVSHFWTPLDSRHSQCGKTFAETTLSIIPPTTESSGVPAAAGERQNPANYLRGADLSSAIENHSLVFKLSRANEKMLFCFPENSLG